MTRIRRERGKASRAGDSSAAQRTPSAGRGGVGGRSGLPFTRLTGIFAGSGVVVALAGFYLLSQGSIALAPVLLTIAFLGFFPLALVK